MSEDEKWPREIWMAERDEHDQGVVRAVLSEHATVARFAGDKERDRDFHHYIDADIYDSADKYHKARYTTLEAENAALRKEVARLREATEWQPIETAPRDGVILLFFANRAWRDHHGNPVTLDPIREQAEKTEVGFCKGGDICEAGTGHSVFEDNRGKENMPTHWKPQPTPPAPL